MATKLSRRTMLGGAAGAAAAGVLAACGGGEIAATATRAAPTVASAATAAAPAVATVASVATAAAPTVNSAASTAVVAATAVAPTVNSAASAVAPAATAASMAAVPAPTMPAANAFAGRTITYFEGIQYYMAVQTQMREGIQKFVTAGGGKVEIAAQTDNGSQNLQKLQAGVETGNPFDLVNGSGGGIQQLLTLNLLTDLTDVVTELKAKYGNLMPILDKGLAKDGKYYAVPWYTSSDVWFLRKDKFDAKGIKVESLKTYDQMRDAALEVSDPGQKLYGWGTSPYPTGDGQTQIFHVIHNWGGAISNKEGTKIVFNTPETVAGVTWLADIYQNPKYKNMLPPGWESWKDSDNNEKYLQGVLGLTANAFTLYAKARDDKNPVFAQTYTAPRPVGPAAPQGLRGGQLGYLYIPRGSKNADVVKETIKYLVSPAVWNPLAERAGGLILPAYESQWANPFFKSDPNYLPLEAQVRDAAGYNQLYYPADQNAAIDAIGSQYILIDMMAQILQKGVKPADAVKEAHDRMVKVFEQFGIKQ